MNLKPWEFRGLGQEDKAECLAYYVVNAEIESYYASERAKIFDKKQSEAESKRR